MDFYSPCLTFPETYLSFKAIHIDLVSLYFAGGILRLIGG